MGNTTDFKFNPINKFGEVRFLNTVNQNFRIKINGNIVANNLGFSRATTCFKMRAGQHTIRLFSKQNNKPVLTQRLLIVPNESFTLGIISFPPRGSLHMNIIKDSPCPMSRDKGYLRFVNYAMHSCLNIYQDNNKCIASNLPYADATDYFCSSPGYQSFIVVPNCRSNDKLKINSLPLERLIPKTVYILGINKTSLSHVVLSDN